MQLYEPFEWLVFMCGTQRLSSHQFSECRLNTCQVTGYYSFIFLSCKFGIPIQFKNIYWALNMCQAPCQAQEPQRQTTNSSWSCGFPFRQKRDMFKNKSKTNRLASKTHLIQCDYYNEICVRAGTKSVLSTFHSLCQTWCPKCRRPSTAICSNLI